MTPRWPLRGKQENILKYSTRIEKKLEDKCGGWGQGLS